MIDSCAPMQAGIATRRLALAACALSALIGALAWETLRREMRSARSRETDRPGEIVTDCERVSAAAIRLIAGERDDPADVDWGGLHAELVALERRTSDVATATRESCLRRSLDQLAGSLISLRTALEADRRLRGDAAASPMLVRAGYDVVVTRCEDLIMSARAVRGRHA